MQQNLVPPSAIRHPHIQTVLASLAPRKILVSLRARELKARGREIILNCGNGVRLLGVISEQPTRDKGLVILIHGWEGSINSAYLLSAAGSLYKKGLSVFRLNLRDHGNSHHLNREFFNSNRLDEVLGAVAEINRLFPREQTYLAGFSLGGNFALRIGINAPARQLKLTKIVALSPLMDPVATTSLVEQRYPVYHRYFIKKWKRSIRKKIALFPDLDNEEILLKLKTLSTMHDYFVPRHTDHPTTLSYLSSYRVIPEQLAELQVPTHIISSFDDPITPWPQTRYNSLSPYLTIDELRYGGHCGFLQDYRLTSWADQRLTQLFTGSTP